MNEATPKPPARVALRHVTECRRTRTRITTTIEVDPVTKTYREHVLMETMQPTARKQDEDDNA